MVNYSVYGVIHSVICHAIIMECGILSRKTPTYQSKNVHGIQYGFPVYKSRVIKSFSLTMENARYLESVPKGQKSDVINRALAYYRKGGRAREAQIKTLSEALGDAHVQLGLITENFDDKSGVKEVKKKRISIIYVLTYPFQLLKDRLGW